MTSQRILLLGLDSATWTLLDGWIKAGLLPNLASLRQRSLWGQLQSTIHPITASAWVTLLTGKNPGKHGIYDFVQRKRESYGLVMTNASMINSSTLYDLLSDANKRIISINMPYTFPPKAINGSIIAGLFAPSTGPELAYPSSLWEKVNEIAPRYCIAPDYNARANDPLQAYIDDMHDSVDQRSRLARWLLLNEEWDLFTLVYTEPDEIQHAFWHCLEENLAQFPEHRQKYGNPILDLYQHIDREIGSLLSLLDDETQIWVVSDHGATSLKYWVNLNRLLNKQGMLTFNLKANNKPISYRLARIYKRVVPNKARRAVSRVLGQRFEHVKAHIQTRLFADSIDWSKTKVYALGAMGSLYINLKGREPHGIVKSGEEYEQLCHEVIELLKSFRDPNTNQCPIASIKRGSELYHGDYASLAPDLVIIWADLHYNGRSHVNNTSGIIEVATSSDISQLPLTGNHDYYGIVMICPSSTFKEQTLDNVHIADIAPSLLTAFGLPVPEDMDGKPIPHFNQDVFEQGIQYKQFKAGAVYDLTEEDILLVERRLSELGYL